MSYDDIIIGAGSAGAVLAARLSEDPSRRVLLLEAGPDHPRAVTPAGVAGVNFIAAVSTPGRVWPNLDAIRAVVNKPRPYVRGRGVGGSSAVNALVGMRGCSADYDRWEQELGCVGWGWSEMRDAFLEVEDDLDHGGDGRGGPIPLRRPPRGEWTALDLALEAAVRAAGFGYCPDYHADGATGFGPAAFTVRDNGRVSTNDAYLEPARQRSNLEIRGEVVVDRVLVEGRRAVGVRTADGDDTTARSVTVSAGAIHSPAILLRSGIGPEIGLPVGHNLTEHPTAPVHLMLNASGRLPTTAHNVASVVLRYTSGLPEAGGNDMQIQGVGSLGINEPLLSTARVLVAVMRVYSRGQVRLRSSDPHDDPVVEFSMLSDDRDLFRLREGIRLLRRIVLHPELRGLWDRALAGSVPVEALPNDDDALDAWLFANVDDYVHAVGTCRMGAIGDPAAVVDTQCRVIGFEGLRVVDASVMPDIPRANTHLTTVAIAERIAAAIRTSKTEPEAVC